MEKRFTTKRPINESLGGGGRVRWSGRRKEINSLSETAFFTSILLSHLHGNPLSCWSIGVCGHAHTMEDEMKDVGEADCRQRAHYGADVEDAIELRRVYSLH